MAISLLEAIDLTRRGFSLAEITNALKMQSEFNKLEEEHPELKNLVGIKEDDPDNPKVNYRELYDNEVKDKEELNNKIAELEEQVNLLSVERDDNKKTIEELQKEITRTNVDNTNTNKRSIEDIYKNR